ncbi:helix-turn-helix domain-containing protein [Micromonospora sp. NPDC049903]|uniref:helix-turn-helix domain-containing protein n=1 Tax=Micromonospora sp. NPDC049903 TaxID=3364276 RepID=UPI003799BEBA
MSTRAIIGFVADVPLPETCRAEQARIWIWLGQAAYLGPSLRLKAHSGSVHCFALGVDGPFTLQADDIGERRTRSALIQARTRHRVIADDGRMLFFYLDPGSGLAEGVRARMTERTSSVGLDYQHESSLIGHVQETSFPDPARLREFVDPPNPGAMDERIRTAIGIMRAHPDQKMSAAQLAAEVHLSTSRFLHLFSANAHTSFRRYRLWARMLHVALAVGEGMDLTRASIEAGFASPGHFSDSFHTMFGLTASRLLSEHTRLVVLDTR